MNSAIDVITWLGGNCCVPSACRNRPSTTMIRTKPVVISRMAGARLTTVSSSMTCSVDARPCGLVQSAGPPIPFGSSGRATAGWADLAARTDPASANRSARPRRRPIAAAHWCASPRSVGAGRNGVLAGCQQSVLLRHRRPPYDDLGRGFRCRAADGSRPEASCWNTWRNVGAALRGWAWRQSPASRLTSSASVTSVRVSSLAGVTETSRSLWPQRSRWDLLAAGQGGAAEHLEDVVGQEDRAPRCSPPHEPGHQEEQAQHQRQGCWPW